MDDFTYDILQKKRLARSAFHKKNGLKSKKCSLPSDNLTIKQLHKKNGVLMNYSLNKPMTWEEFCSMPQDLQKEYIDKLKESFGITLAALAKFFGKNVTTIKNHFAKNSLAFDFCVGHKMTKNQRERFLDWQTGDKKPVKNNQQTTLINMDTFEFSFRTTRTPSDLNKNLVILIAGDILDHIPPADTGTNLKITVKVEVEE